MDACYRFAGIVGVQPHGLTLRQLWKMASGVAREKRQEMAHLTRLVWDMCSGKIDIDEYIAFGIMRETGKGGPVKLSRELEAKVAAEAARLRENNPGLPKLKGVP